MDLPDLDLPAQCGLQCVLDLRAKGCGVDEGRDDADQEEKNNYRNGSLNDPASERADK